MSVGEDIIITKTHNLQSLVTLKKLRALYTFLSLLLNHVYFHQFQSPIIIRDSRSQQ